MRGRAPAFQSGGEMETENLLKTLPRHPAVTLHVERPRQWTLLMCVQLRARDSVHISEAIKGALVPKLD